MGLITKQIEIKPVGSNIAYYKSKGYEVNYGELLTVNTEDLPPTCQKIITAQCDNPECKCIVNIQYRSYATTIKRRNGYYYCSNCKSSRILGENNPNYNANLTEEEREARKRLGFPGYRPFIKNVFIRDNYTCQHCGKYGTDRDIVVHHLNSWTDYPDQRIDIDNGITLCEKCHKEFHKQYGYGHNTKEQYEEWASK